MALPYPTKVILPFDIATAQDMNERHANDVSLANGSGLDDEAVTSDKIDFTTLTSTANQTSAITFPAGVTYTDSYLTKVSNIAIFSGFFQKTGNFNTGDLVATLPVGYRPPSGAFRAAIFNTGSNSAARVEVTGSGQVTVRNISGAGTIVFQIVFPTA